MNSGELCAVGVHAFAKAPQCVQRPTDLQIMWWVVDIYFNKFVTDDKQRAVLWSLSVSVSVSARSSKTESVSYPYPQKVTDIRKYLSADPYPRTSVPNTGLTLIKSWAFWYIEHLPMSSYTGVAYFEKWSVFWPILYVHCVPKKVDS